MKPAVGESKDLNRRDFLKAAGLSLGVLSGAGLACGRTGREAAPAATSPPAIPPTFQPTATGIVTSPPTTPAGVLPSETAAADLVVLHGKVITVDPSDTIAQALAVKDGLIQAVGTDAQIGGLVGPNSQVIDAVGRAVSPGLIDAHNHFQVMGQMHGFFVAFLPPDVRTIEELQAALAETVAQKPEGEWIQGYYLGVTEGRLPDRNDLDPVSPSHPVWIMQQGGHYGSANSLALQIAGINADTPDPPGGVIARDSRGEPTGVFYNHRAMDLLRMQAPRITAQQIHDNVVDTQPLFASCGVTSFQDNNVRGTDTIATYLDAGREGQLYLRGDIFYTLEWPADIQRALGEIDYGGGDELLRFAGFKFLLDGQALMAYCLEPHNGERWDTPTWEPQNFKEAVRQLHDTGLQICVHCVGDAAVELTLDAFEEAMNGNPRTDPRHRIEHCVLTTPQQTQRIKDLGVVISTQPQFLRVGGDHWAQVFGEERTRRAIVTREWLDAGVHVALGSDAPTTPWYTPQVTLFGAVTRVTGSNQRHEPDQALTVQEALRAHTIGAAYAAHQEGIKGSLEEGKLADLVLWNQDPYTAPTSELWKIPIDLTIVGGRVVYER